MLATLVCAKQDPAENLNRKIRVTPSQTAARIGTGVVWESNWDVTITKSRDTGKPIFWYVPTLPGTFTDRKKEIDRYMLAGPFSWPAIVDELNRNYVPYRKPPTKEQAATFELKPYKFVEPGFLILDSSQQVTRRVDHLTTLHPIWLASLIAVNNDAAIGTAATDRTELDAAWREFRNGNFAATAPLPKENDLIGSEKLLLAGMFEFRRGEHAAAKILWEQASRAEPDSPLAWKAAAEAEGFGPFVRGMEVHSDLPEAAMLAGIKSSGSAAPEGTYDEPALWHCGVNFLLGMQRADGGFFDSDYDFGGFDSLPNVHAAVTSLCGMALLGARDRVKNGLRDRVDSAIQRAASYVLDEKNHNPKDRDEILWSYAYRVRFLSRLLASDFGDRMLLVTKLQYAVEALESIQLKNGGWYHEYANPFVTGTALGALYEAQMAGAKINSEKLESGLKALLFDRFPNGAYPYGSGRANSDAAESPSHAASAGRMAICELALWQWKKITDEQFQQAAQISLDNQRFLEVAYKYDNHTSTMAYGGFFFWYDMQARAEMISQLPDSKLRKKLAAAQHALVMKLPEVDGCFVDSHELGRCYGTAMAQLSLADLEKAVSIGVKNK